MKTGKHIHRSSPLTWKFKNVSVGCCGLGTQNQNILSERTEHYVASAIKPVVCKTQS